MRFLETPGRRRKRKLWNAGFLPEWRPWLSQRVPGYASLTATERERLEAIALDLLVEVRWEAAHDFEITDEVKVTVAGQAALMALGLPDDCYRDVDHVIVRGSTWVVEQGPDFGEPGLDHPIRSRDPDHIIGEAGFDGPVLIVWDSVLEGMEDPHGGGAVVFHELAHKLDLLADGIVDGTPPIDDPALLERWVDVCTAALEDVQDGHGPPVLLEYAGTDPGELFAVATEVFFAHPVALRTQRQDLYEVLASYFAQDPIARI